LNHLENVNESKQVAQKQEREQELEREPMSLKVNLEAEIRKRGELTYAGLLEFLRVWGYAKSSNAERRLREIVSENSDIEAVVRKNYIYSWRIKEKQGKLF